MNKDLHKIIFSKVRNAYVVVSEIASSVSGGATRSSSSSARAASTFGALSFVVSSGLTLSFMLMASAWAAPAVPNGGTVAQGNVAISQSGNVMTVNQSSDKAIVNWQSFSIGTGAAVNIVQPSASSTHLSRVTGNDPSVIQGQLQSNGQVVLVNPNGIVVGKDGSVSANSFTASTLNITDADFMAGKYQYARNGANGEVINQGKIETAAGGYVALLGAKVTNDGTITSQQGAVYLGAGDAVAVPVTGSGRIKFEVSPAAINTSVNNNKDAVIVAEGGQVYMRAASLNDLAVASVQQTGSIDVSGAKSGNVTVLADKGKIKATGTIKANSTGTTNGVPNKGGNVIIGRDLETGVLAASTDVSGAKLQAKDGFVETSADYLETAGIQVQAKTWLLDPVNVEINSTGLASTAGNSVVKALDIDNALNGGTSVTISTGSASASAIPTTIPISAGSQSNGDIFVNASISKTSGPNASLTLIANRNINVAANTNITSSDGKLDVIFNSNSTGAGGNIVLSTGSKIISNGGNITLGGGNGVGTNVFAVADGISGFQGISLNAATIGAGGGNIVMNGMTATTSNVETSSPTIAGIFMSGGSISTIGDGSISLTGMNRNNQTIKLVYGSYTSINQKSTGFEMSGGTITGGSIGVITIEGNSTGVTSSTSTEIKGVNISGAVTSTGGHININGYGGGGTKFDNGVDIFGSVTTPNGGNINITGIASTGGRGGNVGVLTNDSSLISSSVGHITIDGKGGTGNGEEIRNHGVQISGSNAIRSGSGDITVTGTAINNDNLFSQGVIVGGGGLSTNSGNIKVDAKVLNMWQVAASITAPIKSTSGDVYIRSVGASITNSGSGTISGRNVSINNSGGSPVLNVDGSFTEGTLGADTWPGQHSRVGISLGASVTAANNLNIYGNQTGSDTGIVLSSGTLSGQYIKVTGKTNTGYKGVDWAGGTINTTGTSGFSKNSIVKGISGASTTASNGFGALMITTDAAHTADAAAGTTLTLAGEATKSVAGQNTKQRGILVQGGNPLTVSGDVTLDGSSKSSDGISFEGVLNMANVSGVTNKLTIKGTTAAASSSALKGVNFSGTLNAVSTPTSSINILGDAQTASGDIGVNISGAITGGAANVNIKSTRAAIVTSAAISGANISIDNTNGSINASTGAFIAAGGTAGTANAISIGGDVTATGNLNLYGVSTSGTGINLAAAKSISGANIQATGSTGSIYGLSFAAGSNITTTGASGASLLTGFGASTSVGLGNAATQLWGNTLTAASGTTLTIAGNATTIATANYLNTRGLRVEGDVNTYGAVILSGTSKSDDGLIVQNGAINVKTGSLTLNGVMTATGAISGQAGVAINKPITLSNGTSLAITGQTRNTNTTIAFAETGVAINSAISQAAGQTTAGNISITGSSSSFANSNGVVMTGAVSTGSGNINIIGQRLVAGNGASVSTNSPVSSTSGNIVIQGIGGTVTQSAGTISGANIVIDNTGAGLTSLIVDSTGGQPAMVVGTALGGSIDGSTGAITPGSRLNFNNGGVSISGDLSTPGNINIRGNSATATYTGAYLTSTGSMTTSGSSSNINVQSNASIIYAGTVTSSGSGGVTIAAGGVSASSAAALTAASGATITQNVAGNVTLSTSGLGNLTTAKINNNGAGNVILAAGTALLAGDAGGGQVLTAPIGNTVTTNKIYVYSGSLTGTGKLSTINSGYSLLKATGYGYDASNINAQLSTAYGAGGVTIPGSASNTQVLFRDSTAPNFNVTLNDASKTYGTNDPTFIFSVFGNPTDITQIFGNNEFALSTTHALSGINWTGTPGTRVSGETVGSYNYTGISNNLSSIQTITNTPKLTVNRANLTITGNAISSVYDGVTTYSQLATNAGFTTTGLVNGVVNGVTINDTVTSVNSAFVDVADASGVAQAGEAARRISGASGDRLGNYNIFYANSGVVSGNVARATITLTGANTTSAYNAAPQTNTYSQTTNSGTLNANHGLGSDSLIITGMGSGRDVVTGGYADNLQVTAGAGTSRENYDIRTTNGKLTITPKALTLNGLVVANKTYDTTTNAIVQTAATLDGVIGLDNVSVNGLSASFGDANAGVNKAIILIASGLTGSSASNYILNTDVPVKATIAQKNATVTTTSSLTGNTYNGSQYSLSAPTITGVYLSDTVGATQAGNSGTNAGTDNTLTTLTGNATTLNNYNFEVTEGTLKIDPKALIVSAIQGSSLVFSGDIQSQTNSITGLVLGDNITVNGLVSQRNAGNYNSNLSLSGSPTTLRNYEVTLNNASFNIAKVQMTSNTASSTFIYNGTTRSLAAPNVTGIISGTDVQVTQTGKSRRNAGSTQSVTTLTGTDANNYVLSSLTEGMLNIAKANLTLAATTDIRTFDGTTNSGVAVTTSTLGEGDSMTGLTQSFGSKNVRGPNGSTLRVNSDYVINDGNNGANYSVATTDAAGTITPALVTVSGVTAQSKTFDGTNAAFLNTTGLTIKGVVVGESISTSVTGQFASDAVGSNKQVNLAMVNTAGSGTDLRNYSFTNQATTTADINAAAVVPVDNSSSTRSSPTFTGTASAQTSTAAARNAVVVGGGAQGGEFQLASTQECATEACVCEVSDFDKSVELCYEEDIPSARSRVSSR